MAAQKPGDVAGNYVGSLKPAPAPMTAGDLNAYLRGQLLTEAETPYKAAHTVGGTPGGYVTVSNAAARAASNASYEKGSASIHNVFGQGINAVKGRNAGIAAGYGQASAAIEANAAARQQAIQEREGGSADEFAQAAANLGLTAAPSSRRLQEIDAAGIDAANTNADAWAGLNASDSGRAVERNNAVADSLRYSRGQAQTELAKQLQQILATEQDTQKYVGGSGGTHISASGTTPYARDAIYKYLISQGRLDDSRDLSLGRLKSSNAGSTSTTTTKNAAGQTTTSTTKRRKTKP